MTTRPESGHDDDGVRNVVVERAWTAECRNHYPTFLAAHMAYPPCEFIRHRYTDRVELLDVAQSHVRATGHEMTFTSEVVWRLTKAT